MVLFPLQGEDEVAVDGICTVQNKRNWHYTGQGKLIVPGDKLKQQVLPPARYTSQMNAGGIRMVGIQKPLKH